MRLVTRVVVVMVVIKLIEPMHESLEASLTSPQMPFLMHVIFVKNGTISMV